MRKVLPILILAVLIAVVCLVSPHRSEYARPIATIKRESPLAPPGSADAIEREPPTALDSDPSVASEEGTVLSQTVENLGSADEVAFARYVDYDAMTEEDSRKILAMLRKESAAPIKGSLSLQPESVMVITGQGDGIGGKFFEFTKRRDGQWAYAGSGFIIE